MAALGLCCCQGAFRSCGQWGYSLVAVRGLLLVVACLAEEPGLQGTQALVVAVHGLSSCSLQAYLHCGMWDPPGPEIELVSPSLQSGFLTSRLLEALIQMFLTLGSFSFYFLNKLSMAYNSERYRKYMKPFSNKIQYSI